MVMYQLTESVELHASHDGTNGLKLAGALVTASAGIKYYGW